MKRRANQGNADSRALIERYGRSARERIYRRRLDGKPFAVFLIDDQLSTASYPSLHFSGLNQDHGHCLVGIYTQPPSLKQIVEDLDEAERAHRLQCAAAAVPA